MTAAGGIRRGPGRTRRTVEEPAQPFRSKQGGRQRQRASVNRERAPLLLEDDTTLAMARTAEQKQRRALVLYPDSQRYVVDSLRSAFAQRLPDWKFISQEDDLDGDKPDLQFCDYDALEIDWAMDERTQLSSYVIRKG